MLTFAAVNTKRGDVASPLFILTTEKMKAVKDHVTALLAEKFKEEGFQDFFIVDIKMKTNNRMDVFVESDSVLNFRHLSKLNRYLQGHIDEAGWMGEVYTLDVSSPGVGQPLKLKRQYLKNIGRKVEVRLLEGKPESGKLLAVEENEIVIEQEKTRKEKKKKIKELVKTSIPFDNIKQTIVKISFN